jgi:hypothetical protein
MKDNIILIAATNRPDILDPALLRPGRFDRQVVVDRPDRKGRKHILEVHTRGKPLAQNIDLDTLAGQTPGFTGADLANLINEAALLTARSNKREITMLELEEGIMRVIAGPEKKSRVMSEKERLITAYHELGHAIVGHLLPNSDPVHKVSIISRGQALGYTISLPTEDKFLTTRAELNDTMAMTLGGRAAEEIVFGEITTGASNDLEKVTETASRWSCAGNERLRRGSATTPFLGREFRGPTTPRGRPRDDDEVRCRDTRIELGYPLRGPRAARYVCILPSETIELMIHRVLAEGAGRCFPTMRERLSATAPPSREGTVMRSWPGLDRPVGGAESANDLSPHQRSRNTGRFATTAWRRQLLLVVLIWRQTGGQGKPAAAKFIYAGKAKADLSAGPCLSEGIPGLSDWVVDIAHDPRQAVDDQPANQCQSFRDGETHHFVELTPDGQLIRAQ